MLALPLSYYLIPAARLLGYGSARPESAFSDNYVIDALAVKAHARGFTSGSKRCFDLVRSRKGCRGVLRMGFRLTSTRRNTPMKIKVVALAAFAALSLLVTSSAFAAEPSFVGKWKFNPEKSQLTGLTYKVEDAQNGQYSFVFGDDKETLSFDGKEHATKYGNNWSITKTGANSWKWVMKRDGKVFNDATWTVSDDGQTSTYVATETRPDGSTSKDETTLKRTSGSPTGGLVGTWEGTGTKIGSPSVLELAKDGDGYAMKTAVYKSETTFKLDGKDYTPKGPRVAEGTTVSAKGMGADKMELTYKLKGKTTETDRWEVSADGKTLTDTITFSGETKPEVDVFDRE